MGEEEAWIALLSPIEEMGDAGGHSGRGWVLTTVAISDPPASRSDPRTVEGALARTQSGVPTKEQQFWGKGA
jgi:hypothetical protein